MVIAIHNAVNERTWQEILKYESLHSKDCIAEQFLNISCMRRQDIMNGKKAEQDNNPVAIVMRLLQVSLNPPRVHTCML